MGKYRPAISSMSMGHAAAGHDLPLKLRIAKQAGFEGIEIFYACLEGYAKSLPGDNLPNQLREAAKRTAKLAKELGLDIVVLQPFLHYDGIIDPEEHKARLNDAILWFELCRHLGTDLMQIPSNFRLDDGITGDLDKIVSDLRELADAAAQQNPPIRLAYEALAWGTHVYTWQTGWDIVTRVDRPNFGVVLDSFHIAGYDYADPSVPGTTRPDGGERLHASIEELVHAIPGDRVFYLQVVDGERLEKPITKDSGSPYYVATQPARMSWSRNCRLFPYETERGAFMPIEKVVQAFLKTGFTGWISFELFNRQMNDTSSGIPQELAQRGFASWETMKQNLQL